MRPARGGTFPRPARTDPRAGSCAARSRQTPGAAGTRASLQADLLAAHERAARPNALVRQLEKRLSELLGEQTWQQSGLGAPADIDALSRNITRSSIESHVHTTVAH